MVVLTIVLVILVIIVFYYAFARKKNTQAGPYERTNNLDYGEQSKAIGTTKEDIETKYHITRDKRFKQVSRDSWLQDTEAKLDHNSKLQFLQQPVEPEKKYRPENKSDKGPWVPQNKYTSIAGYSISGGMIYVGKSKADNGYYGHMKPELIDPRLDVDRYNPDYSGSTLGYYPSYSSISPQSRAAYLHWLSHGRNNPDAAIGYVFLFFYGLERRVLVDLRGQGYNEEINAIIDEVKRLLTIYNKNNSFCGYAENFLTYCLAKQERYKEIAAYSRGLGKLDYEHFPVALCVGIADFMTAAKPIPADWALDWVVLDPRLSLRTPAKRCQAQLKSLFAIRYYKEFGDGMVVKPNRSMLKITYRPASSGFLDSCLSLTTNIPDIGRLNKPVSKLRQIVEKCVEDLDAYSRYLGKHEDQPDSMQAVLRLPFELLSALDIEPLKQTRNYLSTCLASANPAVIPLPDLLNIWNLPVTNRLSKKDSILLAQLLEGLGVGVEPDARFTGSGITIDSNIVIFTQVADTVTAPSAEYSLALLRMQITALISLADNIVCDAERDYMHKMISGFATLTEAEKIRLRAHLTWFLQSGPTLSRMKKRLQELPAKQKEVFAGFLVAMAQADGNLDPNEVKLLAKTFAALGFAEDKLHSMIHQHITTAAADIDTPVVVQTAQQAEPGFNIPGKKPAKTKVSLDQAAIKRKISETTAVSSLLHDIFEEEQTPETTMPDIQGFAGLAPGLASFLKELSTKHEWPRPDLEQVAQKHSLMLDGAMEALNELAYELTDQPLIDGDDLIAIDLEIYKEMQDETEA